MGWHGDDADYRRLFEQSPVPTLVVDRAGGTIVEGNDAARRLLEGAGDLIGTPGLDLVADLPETSGDDPAARVVRRVDTGNGTRTLRVAVLPSNADGTSFVQLHDITDLVSVNASLLRHATDLEVRTGSLETVSARIAHDLRSPLATIAGFVDLLRSSHHDLDDEQRTTILDRVSANAHRLAAMVTETLDDARRLAGVGSNAAEELLATVAETFEAQRPEDAVLTTVPEVDDLPVPVGAVRQLVVNLVDNSIKFRSPERPLSVEVRIAEVDGRVEIVVDDNGTGLGDDVEEIFETGARGDNATDVAGTGLGLAYARRAVEAIGGRLVAEPRDVGARFRVQLPPAAPVVAEPASEGFAGGLSARQLDRIIDVAPVAMVVVDLTLQVIIRVNSAAVTLLGQPADSIIGRPATDFLERPDILEPVATGAPRSSTTARLLAGHERVPAALWMVGFDDTALLIVQAQDLRGVVPDDYLSD